MLSYKDKEAIWSADEENIRRIYDSLKNSYKLKYNYKGVYKPIETYLKRLIISSRMNNENSDFYRYIVHIEKFFFHSIQEGFITPNNINRILTILTNEFRILKFLPEKDRGLYGRSVSDIIEINPDLGEVKSTLYMIHEIGHKIIKLTEGYVIYPFVNSLKNTLENKGFYNKFITYPKESIYYGFQMMEEALAQELGEILTSKIFNYKRKPMITKNELGTTFKTNFDYYGLFQEITIAFGKTLRGVGGTTKQDDIILRDMLKKAFNTKDSLTLDIIKEYNDGDGHLYLKLYYMLANMGNFLNEKYATLGLRCFKSMNIPLNTSRNRILYIAKECFDKRLEPFGGYPEPGFMKR